MHWFPGAPEYFEDLGRGLGMLAMEWPEQQSTLWALKGILTGGWAQSTCKEISMDRSAVVSAAAVNPKPFWFWGWKGEGLCQSNTNVIWRRTLRLEETSGFYFKQKPSILIWATRAWLLWLKERVRVRCNINSWDLYSLSSSSPSPWGTTEGRQF